MMNDQTATTGTNGVASTRSICTSRLLSISSLCNRQAAHRGRHGLVDLRVVGDSCGCRGLRQANVLNHGVALAGQLHQVLCLVRWEVIEHQHLPSVEDGELLRFIFLFWLPENIYRGTRSKNEPVDHDFSFAYRLSNISSLPNTDPFSWLKDLIFDTWMAKLQLSHSD